MRCAHITPSAPTDTTNTQCTYQYPRRKATTARTSTHQHPPAPTKTHQIALQVQVRQRHADDAGQANAVVPQAIVGQGQTPKAREGAHDAGPQQHQLGAAQVKLHNGGHVGHVQQTAGHKVKPQQLGHILVGCGHPGVRRVHDFRRRNGGAIDVPATVVVVHAWMRLRPREKEGGGEGGGGFGLANRKGATRLPWGAAKASA